MPIDNTTMDVIVSTVTAVVQEPTISTITATVKDNVVQIPFDVISQVRDFYEICWSKLIWFVSVIGTIGIIILGYIGFFVPKKQDKKLKELLSKQEKIFNEQICTQRKDFENKFKELENDSYRDKSKIFGNTAILLDMIYRASNKEQDDYFIKNNCVLLCSAVTSLLKIGISIYEKDNMESLNKKLETLNYILKEKNKNLIDKNLLKKVLDGLKNIDGDKINASLQDNIKNITKFYDTL